MGVECGRKPSSEWRALVVGGFLTGNHSYEDPNNRGEALARSLGARRVLDEDEWAYRFRCDLCGGETGDDDRVGCDPAKHHAYYDKFPRGSEVPR